MDINREVISKNKNKTFFKLTTKLLIVFLTNITEYFQNTMDFMRWGKIRKANIITRYKYLPITFPVCVGPFKNAFRPSL